MNDILGAKFVIDGDIAQGFITQLGQLEKRIQDIGKNAREVATLLSTNGTASDRVSKSNKTTTGNFASNTKGGLIDAAQYYTNTIKGLDSISKYHTKLHDLHTKELQYRNEINSDFRIMARETGKVLRRIQSLNLIGGPGGVGNIKSGAGLVSGMQAAQIINEKLTQQQTKAQIEGIKYNNESLRIEQSIGKDKQTQRIKDERHQADMHAKAEKERRADEAHKDKQRKRDEAHAKKMATRRGGMVGSRDGYINEASFGGIYLTGLATQYALAPYRAFRDYEKEVTIAAKNVEGLEIKSPADIRKYGETRILSRYANPGDAAMQFGISPIELAKMRGQLVQTGFGDKTIEEQKELNKAVGELIKLTSVLEADPETAMKFVSFAPKFFNKEFLAFQGNNGYEQGTKQGTTEFVSYLGAFVNELSKTNPHTAKAAIEAVVRGGSGASVAGMPAWMYMDFLSGGLAQGVSPQVISTISSRIFPDFAAAMKKNKIWLDPKSEAQMMKIAEGKESYLGMTGDVGAFFQTLGGALNSVNNGDLSPTELNLILKKMARGHNGQQNVIGANRALEYIFDKKSGKFRTKEEFEKKITDMQGLNLGTIKKNNLPEELQRMVKNYQKEGELAMMTLQAYEERAKTSGKLFNIVAGQESAPLAKMLLGGFTKFLTGYSPDDILKAKLEGKELGVEDMGGLIGAIQKPAVKAALLTLGTLMLTAIAIQLGKIIFRGGSGILGNLKEIKPFLANILGRSALFGGGTSIKGGGKIGKFFSQKGLLMEDMILNRIAPLNDTTPLSDIPTSWQRRHRWNRDIRPALRTAGNVGLAAGTAYALSETDGILKFIDSMTTSSVQGVKKFSETDVGKGLVGGLGALDPMEAKNMVAYWLLMSGNKAMATGAAMHLGSKFFNGFYDKAGLNEGWSKKEIAISDALRSAAIGVLMYSYMLGPAGLYPALGAAAYLGFDFAAHWLGKQGAKGAAEENIQDRKSELDQGLIKKGVLDAEGNVLDVQKLLEIQSVEREANEKIRSLAQKGSDRAKKLGLKEGGWLFNLVSKELAFESGDNGNGGQFFIDKKRAEADKMLKNFEQPMSPVNVTFNVTQNKDGSYKDIEMSLNDKKYSVDQMFKNKKTNFTIQDIPSYNTA